MSFKARSKLLDNMPDLGATIRAGGVQFRVWAGHHRKVTVVLSATSQTYELHPEGKGYFSALIPGLGAGTRYWYQLDGGVLLPDPCSRSQPEGVDGPSEVIWLNFDWNDQTWQGIPREELILQEIHVGTATSEGTFEALIPKLPHWKQLGITALELLPVGQFPGDRNWGYDSAYPFAPAAAYGGARGLQRLVNAAHLCGLAVLLDVVYNHVSPEGNHWREFGSDYFSPNQDTPWGDALNYTLPDGHATRALILANALEWIHTYHLDGLRVDATHEMEDESNPHVLQALTTAIHRTLPANRHVILIAEDAKRDPKILTPTEQDGYGFDAVWRDDFHHHLHRALTGEQQGYYADYHGTVPEIARVLQTGGTAATDSRNSASPANKPVARFHPSAYVCYLQNHDQVGNRPCGERLTSLTTAECYRAASTLLLLSPFTPMLWMGQEWGASTPFYYFTDYQGSEADRVDARRAGELSAFPQMHDPAQRSQLPHPQASETFAASKLWWHELQKPYPQQSLRLYQHLLTLRKHHPAIRGGQWHTFEAMPLASHGIVMLYRKPPSPALLVIVNLQATLHFDLQTLPVPTSAETDWQLCLTTEADCYGGTKENLYQNGTGYALCTPGAVVFESNSGP